MHHAVLSATGFYAPPEVISNAELVQSFNAYVADFNAKHGDVLSPSSEEFIVKASGILRRHVVNKSGILDIHTMRPQIETRDNNVPSILCEMALNAANDALKKANKTPEDIDLIVVACSNLPRAYPALAVEVQHFLGAKGFAYDMNVACASAAFGLQAAVSAVQNGNARCALVLNPEMCTAHLNFCDRDSHFIFGDACTAMLIQNADDCENHIGFTVLDTQLQTHFSNNIRNNFGFLNRTETTERDKNDVLFVQNGRLVFRDVVPFVANLLKNILIKNNVLPDQVKRLWLHQANLKMNQLIAQRVLGHEPTSEEAPIILDEYANTSSAGCVIAFHHHHDDFQTGEIGILSGFGAGYSAGCALLQKR